jgi:hypothetical protein
MARKKAEKLVFTLKLDRQLGFKLSDSSATLEEKHVWTVKVTIRSVPIPVISIGDDLGYIDKT